jgi:phosphoglycolate phosphatase
MNQARLQPGERAEVWFDLDGTLVDSAPGVLWSLCEAFRVVGVSLQRVTARDVVGPMLEELLDRLAPSADHQLRDRLATAFRMSYDSCGYLQSQPFNGVDFVLRQFAKSGHRLRIITNKRQSAAERIVRHVGWMDLFAGVHGRPETGGCGQDLSKPHRAMEIVSEKGVRPRIVVGDGADDLQVACVTSATFVLACWGYGCEEVRMRNPDVQCCVSPASLAAFL